MNIAFLDPIDWDYTPETVYHKPMGGSSSAICYLAEAIAHRGHQVFLLNNTSTPGEFRGVMCLPHAQVSPELRRSLDVLIVSNLAGQGQALRAAIGEQTRLILWSGHAHDQQAIQDLHNPQEWSCYDGIALVSDWQRQQFHQQFQIPLARMRVLRNAISPAFHSSFPTEEPILSSKADPPLLAYTSTPFRGLDLLLDVFPAIRQAVPGTRLQVFSSMKVYWYSEESDRMEYGNLYQRCQEMEGVDYIGALPQPELATALKRVAVLAYPNTFAETSCISVLEAMASGCQIVTSHLGALPETTAGFGPLIPVTGNWPQYRQDFVAAVVRVLNDCEQNVAEINAHLQRQVDYVLNHYTWAQRATEWIDWLTELRQPPVAAGTGMALLDQPSEESLEAVMAHYEAEIAHDPDVMQNYWHLGVALLLRGEVEAAEALWLTTMLKGTPEQVAVWTGELQSLLHITCEQQRSLGNLAAVERLELALQML